MEPIRQIVKVKNHKISITLPNDFNADEVEVIILPKSNTLEIPQWQMDQVRERTEKYLKNPSSAQDIDDFLKDIDGGL
ncbi:hypothetical protein EKM05_11375 [Flavobacterium sp. GSP27]|uniref:Uncharacterized protein n=1 Tax=Flavobacterium bomense TaxID=2497483 RepID=A0A3S0MXA2_9FLAO|nr:MULTISPECIES: hypothetical protein [Flavobacterium]RTY90281.1 hypothetical protein EKL32_21055 [Flavobacterium sp. GSN2]RTY66286.1 hypothetical protein EKL95_12065 [Flavobacterium sp. LB2P53]RTY74289.1 hypothetical protein EKL96_09520 [Flavobacterium sp. LS1R10]RTY83435.1 hypothetical protein EKL97_03895 [Flavobacterium sp. LS1P28]RTY83765.1 hypothetical protein EKL99_04075 [Flavobacterium sp. ZB4P23]